MQEKNPWKTLDSRLVYDNPWISVTEHQVINPNGGAGIYGEVHFKNYAIGVVPVDDEGNTWLVGQYRYPLKAYSWEIPEGGGKLDQEPLEGARRELLEETGFTATNWHELQRMHLSNSVSDELGIMYLATGLTAGTWAPEETEALTLRKLPLADAIAMVLNGQITDSMSVAALLRIKVLQDSGQFQTFLS